MYNVEVLNGWMDPSMNKFLIALITLGTIVSPANANDTEKISGDLYTQHQTLWNAIKSVGVKTYLNPPGCEVLKTKDVAGMYFPNEGKLIICQDNYDHKKGRVRVNWTANDLDTLRHEAHHLVQDCAIGKFGDGYTSKLFKDEALANFIKKSGMNKSEVNDIVEEYIRMEYEPEHIMMELEAYAAARAVTPNLIAQKVIEFCSPKSP